MKMLVAAAVVSQMLLAAAQCTKPTCPAGCELTRTLVKETRERRGMCENVGQALRLTPAIGQCERPAAEPQHSGPCRGPVKQGLMLCTGVGECIEEQLVVKVKFGCRCPGSAGKILECDTDANCPLGEFCRTKKRGDECTTETKCVPYARNGWPCGGMVLPCFREKCAGGLACQGEGLALDLPGTCKPVPTCLAIPNCPSDTAVDETCTRRDFAQRLCIKETLCGQEVACRKK